jgi:hypothetical protein
MGSIPSPRGYERFTDWVIDASQEADIDPPHLWRLQRQETEGGMTEWVRTTAAEYDVSERELIRAVDDIARESDLPNLPVPSVSVTPETVDHRETADGPDQTGDGHTPPVTDVGGSARETRNASESAVESPDSTDAFEEGPQFSDLTDTTDTDPGPGSDPANGGMRAGAGAASEDTTSGRDRQPEPPADDAFVTETEYEQFQEKVQQIVQDLIDFLISYDMLSAEAGTGGSDSDVKQRLQQAAEEADNTADFFKRIETILADIQRENEVDFGDFAGSMEPSKRPSELTEEIERSISELREVQSDIESSGEAANAADTRSRNESGSDTGKRSRNDDPVVLNRLNALTDTIRREIPSYGDGADDTDEPDRQEERQQPERRAVGMDSGRDEPPEQTSRESPAAPPGAAAATAAGAADRSAQQRDSGSLGLESLEDFGSIRQSLLPIDIGWLIAGLSYGGLDMFSTVLVLNSGGNELNPIFGILGESIVSFVIWKTFIMFMLFVVFYPESPRTPDTQEWAVPVVTGLVGAFLTINNLAVFITGSGLL